MCNDLRDEQMITVYNTMPGEVLGCRYEGKVGDMSDELRSRLSAATFYLLSDVEEYDVLAIL